MKTVFLFFNVSFLTNQLLIAMPHMKDPFFSKSVIYICEHNRAGTMGIIINKQFNDSKLNSFFGNLFTLDKKYNSLKDDIYFGGPVLVEKGLIIHLSNNKTPESICVSNSICITSDLSFLTQLNEKNNAPFKLMLGHAGWSSGQLEKELENGDWLIQNTTDDFLLSIPAKQMWKQATKSLGFDTNTSIGMTGQA